MRELTKVEILLAHAKWFHTVCLVEIIRGTSVRRGKTLNCIVFPAPQLQIVV